MKSNCHRRSTPMVVTLIAVLLAPAVATAHPGHLGTHAGLAAGLFHPLTGLDHLLALVGAGLWSYQQKGRTRWIMPAGFVAAIAAGAAAAGIGLQVPMVEVGIACSVIALGVLVATAASLPMKVAAGLAALFACFHGYAHIAELSTADPVGLYVVGFLATSTVVIAAGGAVGKLMDSHSSGRLIRAVGIAIAIAGAEFMWAAIGPV